MTPKCSQCGGYGWQWVYVSDVARWTWTMTTALAELSGVVPCWKCNPRGECERPKPPSQPPIWIDLREIAGKAGEED